MLCWPERNINNEGIGNGTTSYARPICRLNGNLGDTGQNRVRSKICLHSSPRK